MKTRSRPQHAADRAAIPIAMSVEQALRTILEHVGRLPPKEVPLAEAAGRSLAADVTAPADLWPFPRAAMDGYAVRAADTAAASALQPATLRLVGESFAGAPSGLAVTAGAALRIATGAPIPVGADAVIPWEQVVEGQGIILIREAVPPGRHIFPAGEDARRGEVILRTGTRLRGGHLALLAALGITRVNVVARARVAILTAGDELVDHASVLLPGQVRDSNSLALAAEVEAIGGLAQLLGIARDSLSDLVPLIYRGLRADALIVCAGMSVGERDLVKEGLARAGVRLLFWKVSMKPGAPAAFGMAGTTPVFGLPGNPGAAMVAFEALVRPALCAMMGARDLHRPIARARLAAPLRVTPGRRRYLWARAMSGPEGVTVEPLPGQGTATLRSVSDANALLLLSPEITQLDPEDEVAIQLLATPAESNGRARIPIVSVVGAKHAGKTTLIERLLPALHQRGYRVGVIKHDAHSFEMDHPGTDTWRFAAAGAGAVAIADPQRVAVIRRHSGEMPLAKVQGLLGDVDLILVEGYSREVLPRIEVRRSGIAGDKPAAVGPTVAVVTDEGLQEGFTFDDIPALLERIERAAGLNLRPPVGDHARIRPPGEEGDGDDQRQGEPRREWRPHLDAQHDHH